MKDFKGKIVLIDHGGVANTDPVKSDREAIEAYLETLLIRKYSSARLTYNAIPIAKPGDIGMLCEWSCTGQLQVDCVIDNAYDVSEWFLPGSFEKAIAARFGWRLEWKPSHEDMFFAFCAADWRDFKQATDEYRD